MSVSKPLQRPEPRPTAATTAPAAAATKVAAAPKAAPVAAAAPPQPSIDEARLREVTERIAYEMYEKRGRSDGRDFDDWLEAEKAARAHLLAGGA